MVSPFRVILSTPSTYTGALGSSKVPGNEMPMSACFDSPGPFHAPHHRDAERFHPGIALAPRGHLLFQVSLDVFGHLLEEGRRGAAAARACRDLRSEERRV